MGNPPPIKHKLDLDSKYLCDKNAIVNVDRLTTCSGRVTCKNCLKLLKRK